MKKIFISFAIVSMLFFVGCAGLNKADLKPYTVELQKIEKDVKNTVIQGLIDYMIENEGDLKEKIDDKYATWLIELNKALEEPQVK